MMTWEVNISEICCSDRNIPQLLSVPEHLNLGVLSPGESFIEPEENEIFLKRKFRKKYEENCKKIGKKIVKIKDEKFQKTGSKKHHHQHKLEKSNPYFQHSIFIISTRKLNSSAI